ncbi:MAG: hypothetical protein WC304_03945 [Candidatus Gracilibacteria bacterium]|jgi:hypothetical protein
MNGEVSSSSEMQSGIDLIGVENLREALVVRGQEGKFTQQKVEEMKSNAPEWVIDSLVLGEITAAEFLQHCRLSTDKAAASKISEVLEVLAQKALRVEDGKLEAADALVALELTGGIPGEDTFMQSVAFEEVLLRYRLTHTQQDYDILTAAFKKKYSVMGFSGVGSIIKISSAEDVKRIAELHNSLLRVNKPENVVVEPTRVNIVTTLAGNPKPRRDVSWVFGGRRV